MCGWRTACSSISKRLHPRRYAAAALAAAALIAAAPALAAPPPAGAVIENTASASYIDAASRPSTVLSNTVRVTVARVAAFTLTAGQARAGFPGATVYFPHVLTNAGNGADRFDLAALDLFAGTFSFAGLALYADSDGNGVPDSAASVSDTGMLASGAAFRFVAAAVIPGGAGAGQADQMTVRAAGNAAAAVAGGYAAAPAQTNVDVVTVTGNAVVTLTKSLSLAGGPSPGAGAITVTLSYANVTGTPASDLVLTDVIGAADPAAGANTAGFTYVPGSAVWSGGGSPDDANDGADGNGISYDFNGTALLAVTARIAQVPAHGSGTLRFQVMVKAGLAAGTGVTANAARFSWHDGATTRSGTTNQAAYAVAGAAPGPDLTLSKTHLGTFTVGHPGTWLLAVQNRGSAPTGGPITVTDTLPAGFTYVAAGSGGTSWSCSAAGLVVTCTSGVSIPAQASLTPGTHPHSLTIRAQTAAAGTFSNHATVSGGGEPAANAANNAAADPTTVTLSASVSGRVWQDLNHDRQYQASEPTLSGWIVELLDAGDALVASTSSNGGGTYHFPNLVPGAGYKLRFRDPATGNPIVGTPVNGEAGVRLSSATPLNGILHNLVLAPGVNVAEQSLPVDPSGVIYDSLTRQPIAGATVTLNGPAGFNPGAHLVGGQGTVTTGVNGFYQFLLLVGAPSGSYTLAVSAPGYTSPSTLIPAAGMLASVLAGNCAPRLYCVAPQPDAPRVEAGDPTLYHLAFDINVLAAPPDIINNHVPLDPVALGGNTLFVQKTASRPSVELGEFVDYTVRVRNPGVAALADVRVADALPHGFAYVAGSARLGGTTLADPSGGAGPRLSFAVGAIAANTTVTFTYRVRVGAGALQGDGTNRATATGGGISSNTASARVRVLGGVFSERAFILGKVFADCNANGRQDEGERGIPGVRLFIEDGTYALTDGEGQYSLYGLAPRTRTLKVDPASLPAGARLGVIANRQGGAADSRFVDLRNGELHRADFAEQGCAEGVLREIEARHAALRARAPEAERELEKRLPVETLPPAAGDARGGPSSGERNALPGGARGSPAPASAMPAPAGSPAASAEAPKAAPAPLEAVLPDLDNALAFIGLQDGDVLPFAQSAVRVKGTLGATLKLLLNGAEVPASHIGKKSALESKQLQALEYIGVSFKPGRNELVLVQHDPFGNARGRVEIGLVAPGGIARVTIEAPETAPADTGAPVKVRVKLTDGQGVPVTARTPLTLEADAGRWLARDLDPGERGVQVFVEGGAAEFDFEPPAVPGDALLRAASGTLSGERRMAFLPHLRPLVGTGVVEGALNLRRLNFGNVSPARRRDGFEEELRTLSLSSGDGRASAAARAALYLKGKVKGDYLLTLAYDSDKNLRERLYRDIQPDEFYPIYGDSSVQGFDAQSTQRLYVRVDKGRSFLLYGDFPTQSAPELRVLSQYARSLTGVKEHYETGRVSLNAFASRDSLRQAVQEFPANGTSGPFQLAASGGLVNSEKVEVLTRDRNAQGVVLKTEPKARFSDYEIEPFTGRILFKAPIPSVDFNLNPISVRVTYEVDEGGRPFWVGGVDAQVRVTDNLEVGAVMVGDGNPDAEATLRGVNTTVRLAEKTFVVGELAGTAKRGVPGGNARRVELRHDDGKLQVRAHAGKAEAGFDNPSSLLSKGREEAGARASYRLSAETTLGAEALATGDTVAGTRRHGILLKMEQKLSEHLTGEFGLRRSTESATTPGLAAAGTAPLDTTSGRAKLTARLPDWPRLSVFGELEQDLHESERRIVAAGGEYRLEGSGRVYARHEVVSSLAGQFALNAQQRRNTTVFGLDTSTSQDGRLFSEYRVFDALDGRQAQAAVGLRNAWTVAEGLKLHTGSERVRALSRGSAAGESGTSYTGALEYTANPLWKGSTRVELRDAAASESVLLTFGLAGRLSREWSLLARTVFLSADHKGALAGSRQQARYQAGAAYRDAATNRVHSLLRAEHREESDSTQAGAPLRRDADILSWHLHYEPAARWQINTRVAAKWALEDSLGIRSRTQAQLVSARATYDIAARWDIGMQVSMLASDGMRSRQAGAGVEIGYMVRDNLWLSVGYNVFAFKDRDLVDADTGDGALYVRLRFKFDEDLFGEWARASREKERRAGEAQESFVPLLSGAPAPQPR